MQLAFLLIALGFGFKVFAEATSNPKKRIKQIGQFVGGFITTLPTNDGSVLLLGDSNRNGTINVGDALKAANMAVGKTDPAYIPLGRGVDNADVNGDGWITTADANLIANYAGHLINSFPRVL